MSPPTAELALAKTTLMLHLRMAEMLRDAGILTPSDADELWRIAIGNGLTIEEQQMLVREGLNKWIGACAKGLKHRAMPSGDRG
jgi:hypothetical protein